MNEWMQREEMNLRIYKTYITTSNWLLMYCKTPNTHFTMQLNKRYLVLLCLFSNTMSVRLLTDNHLWNGWTNLKKNRITKTCWSNFWWYLPRFSKKYIQKTDFNLYVKTKQKIKIVGSNLLCNSIKCTSVLVERMSSSYSTVFWLSLYILK